MFVEIKKPTQDFTWPLQNNIFRSHALDKLESIPEFPSLLNKSPRSTNVNLWSGFEDPKCTGCSLGLILTLIIGITQLTTKVAMPNVRIISYEFLTKISPIVRYLPLLTIHYKLWRPYCRNPSLELTTKARACKGAGQKGSSWVTSHAPRSAKKCEGMNLHTPKWIPILGVGVLINFQIFRG